VAGVGLLVEDVGDEVGVVGSGDGVRTLSGSDYLAELTGGAKARGGIAVNGGGCGGDSFVRQGWCRKGGLEWLVGCCRW
jgi:hypothetical protein